MKTILFAIVMGLIIAAISTAVAFHDHEKISAATAWCQPRGLKVFAIKNVYFCSDPKTGVVHRPEVL